MNGYTVVSGSALPTLSPPNPPPTTPSSSTFSTSFSAASCVTINNASCWVPLITRNKRNGSGKRRGLLPAFTTGRRGLKCGCGRAPDLLPLECNWEEDYKDHEFIVVNFYHFVSIEDPDDEVAKHLAFLQGLDIRGRIYVNEQGFNAQFSGLLKDALAYVKWLREDPRFSGVLFQVSPALGGHAFPRLKLRYKPSLVQLEGGISHLPLIDPPMRATPLTPCQWKQRLEAANKSNELSTWKSSRNFILLDGMNGILVIFMGLNDRMWTASGALHLGYRNRRKRGFKNLYTLRGGVTHYLKSEGSVEWVGNLFVFDSRLSLPPSAYKPQGITETSRAQECSETTSFARCYICGSQVSELRHRNCANLDCNLLFLCCTGCVNDLRGCCCMSCMHSTRRRPVLPGHQRYEKWHNYRDFDLQSI
ncbi:rhodanese-like domain-containing protein 8, chloroplastic isoform X3 [Rhododendron vialii]|uniref:rhodanese-like domain-containing protein 8, chloroplastic isoform X3 n=1 Tax=Rhododendron vialii TaxID=182163 RepID=UPI00265F34C1|nr:rhodanese-like domain-containing protein 8, chloroplastic isoform X3 [Rhododendron vialii]